jgi:hypothetical protein
MPFCSELQTSDTAIIILGEKAVTVVADSINKNGLRGKLQQMNEEGASVSLRFD